MKGNFNDVINSTVPVVVDAFAEWCGSSSSRSTYQEPADGYIKGVVIN